jgi:hypothetical protein
MENRVAVRATRRRGSQRFCFDSLQSETGSIRVRHVVFNSWQREP